MISRDWSSFLHSQVFRTGVALATLTAAVCSGGTAIIFHSLNSSTPVSVSLNEVAWWSNVRLKVDRPAPTVEVAVPVIQTAAPKAPPVQVAAVVAKKKSPARVAVAPRRIIKREPAAIAESTSALKMRGLHRLLRSQFFVAIQTLDSQKQLDTQFAEAITPEAQPEPETQPEEQPQEPQQELRALAIQLVANYKPVEEKTVEAMPAVEKTVEISDEPLPMVAAAPVVVQSRKIDRKPGFDPEFEKKRIAEPIKQVTTQAPVKAPILIAAKPVTAEKPIIKVEPKLTAPAPKVEAKVEPVISQPAVATPPLVRMQPLVAAAPVATQVIATPIVRPVVNPNPVLLPKPESIQKNSLVDSHREYSKAPEGNVMTVEAFAQQIGLPQAKTRVLSHEGLVSGAQGKWLRTESADHWATLSWFSPSNPGAKIPLISPNSAQLLAKLSGVNVEPSAGIIFGWIPEGWSIEISGRAERPVFLSENHAPKGAKTFAIINVAPGTQWLQGVGPTGEVRSSIAVPILDGTATFLDLSAPVMRDFSGQVFDAKTSRIMPRIMVRVGQAGKAVTTNTAGYFKVPGVATFGDLPVYIETVASQQWHTQRYRVPLERVESLELLRFSDEQLLGWLGQLEGGVSPDSGLVVGALPGLMKKYKLPAFPTLRVVLNHPTLIPEVYSLSRQDQMVERTPLEPSFSRFVAVYLPEGPQIARLKNTNGKVIWSEMVMVAPGVVNVIGPQ